MKRPSNEHDLRPGSAFRAVRAIDYTVIFARDMAAMRRFYEGHRTVFFRDPDGNLLEVFADISGRATT